MLRKQFKLMSFETEASAVASAEQARKKDIVAVFSGALRNRLNLYT